MKRRIASALVAAAVFGSLTYLPGAPAAAAVGCTGHQCSGLDPQTTGCAADGRTIFRTPVYGTGGTSWVEIRWSDACQTNWARTNGVRPNIKAVQDTGYTRGYRANNGAYSWTEMIYSPHQRVKGVIWGGWGTTETPWA